MINNTEKNVGPVAEYTSRLAFIDTKKRYFYNEIQSIFHASLTRQEFRLLIIVLISVISVLSSKQASALELGAGPPELVFEGKTGMLVCRNVSVESDRALRVVFEERWIVGKSAGEGKEQLLPDGKALGLSVALPSSVELELQLQQGKKKDLWRASVPVCIVGERSGAYSGLLLIMPEEGIAGVGVLLRLQLKGAAEESAGVVRMRRAEESKSGEDEWSGEAFLLIEEMLGLLLVGEVLRRAAEQGTCAELTY